MNWRDMTWRECAEDVLAWIMVIYCVLAIAFIPIPLARGLWVWLWWVPFNKHNSPFRFMGGAISLDEFHDADDRCGHVVGFLIPFSPFWRRVRASLVRNRVLQ